MSHKWKHAVSRIKMSVVRNSATSVIMIYDDGPREVHAVNPINEPLTLFLECGTKSFVVLDKRSLAYFQCLHCRQIKWSDHTFIIHLYTTASFWNIRFIRSLTWTQSTEHLSRPHVKGWAGLFWRRCSRLRSDSQAPNKSELVNEAQDKCSGGMMTLHLGWWNGDPIYHSTVA